MNPTVTADGPLEPTAPDAAAETVDLPKVNARYIWLMVLAQFGVFVAFITPIAISLAIRVQSLAPGHDEYLGYITGVGAFVVMFTAPLMGVLSDRTRTRLGRRRPFMIGGLVLGVVSLVVMATAPSILVLGLGWILAQLGWGQVLGNLQNSTADRLPESQRGKVAGLTGFATQIAPVLGVVVASPFAADPLLLFLIPGSIGVVLTLLFVTLVHEDDSRSMPVEDRLTFHSLFGKYLFNPKQYPDYSLNWLARFLFYFGITLNTTFTAYFFASRLGMTVEAVAGIIAVLGIAGVVATTIGALGGGFLSDRLRRRRVFVFAGAALMAVGMVIAAFSATLPVLVAGSFVTSVGLGMFASVDQALLLDVLPERSTQAGRFMGITGFATSIPQAAAPFIGSALLVVGVSGDEKNYTLLFLIAAVLVLVGGLAAMRIRSVR
ncbi:MFS transporter [Glycomyces sp. MUSA5-2]|uniref:MFS transporter n=1 Tax=Glycomyces sp. MUSA5-2 TaxID=2053002 RepID=UPI0030095769